MNNYSSVNLIEVCNTNREINDTRERILSHVDKLGRKYSEIALIKLKKI